MIRLRFPRHAFCRADSNNRQRLVLHTGVANSTVAFPYGRVKYHQLRTTRQINRRLRIHWIRRSLVHAPVRDSSLCVQRRR